MNLLQVFGLVPWVIIGLDGLWMVLTGRQMVPRIPTWLAGWWRPRLFGLVCCLAAVYFGSQNAQSGRPAFVMLSGWIVLSGALFGAFSRRRKAKI